MSAVAISRCLNEADIIEPWCRHTLHHVDHLIVSENDSTDNTLEILQALKDEGLSLTILREATIGDYQASRFTKMMRDVAPDADWVVSLDQDEFIETEGRRYADILALGPQVVRCLPWKSMAWSRSDDQSEINPVVRMRHRLIDETHYSKIAVPKHLALTSELCMGSHFLLPMGDHGLPVEGARLCHFPLRSVDQYRAKAAVAYLQSACVPGVKASLQFASLPDVANIDEDTLERYSRRYASQMPAGWEPSTIEQPLKYLGGALRYTKPGDRFIPALLRQAEKMALHIAELTK